DKVPAFVTADKSGISITGEHFKDGGRALRWNYSPNASLTIKKDLHFEPKDSTGADTYLSTFVVWIHNSKPTGSTLTFQFKKNGRICSWFSMGLDFTGWRTAWVCYERDMEGTPEVGMDEICIIAPDSHGEICIDHLLTAAKTDHRHQTADTQVPFVNKHTSSHWLVVYPHSKIQPDIAAEPVVSEKQKQYIALIERRFKDQIFTPVQVTPEEIQKIRSKFSRYGIQYNNKGEVKGLPIFFERSAEAYERIIPDYNKALFSRNGMELKEYFDLMNQVAVAYNSTTDAKYREELKHIFMAMYDHAVDQGIAWGSCLGNFTHYGYSFRGFYTSYFLMKNLLRDAGKLNDAAKSMRWYAIANEVFIKPEEKGMDMDAFNTVTTGRIASILMMENTPEKVQYLKSFSRWIDNGCLPSEGLSGSFKSDGSGFHHRNLYPAYAIGGLNGATKMIHLLSGTGFAVSELAHSTVKNVLLAMRFYCNKTDFPLALSGRHPDGKGALVPMHYATMALAGTPSGKDSVDLEMGNAYLRLVTEDKTNREDNPEYVPFVPSARNMEMIESLKALGCVAEPNPQGNMNLGYGCVSVHRRKNWSAVARGHSRYIWAAEHYRGENLFGRYLAHGSLQIMTANNASIGVNSKTSGWSEAGFDWARIPGATAIRLPLDKLKANVLNVDTFSGYEEMLLSDESFAGGISLEELDGAFGMKLHEHDKDNGSLRARKSYHVLDHKILCIGSEIENSNTEFDTETTVFQLETPDEKDK
ncbi:MAG: chondroitinase, partial [Paramuribaculum sp.]|nr:chondroitinase [Paramuribaculum sp.]